MPVKLSILTSWQGGGEPEEAHVMMQVMMQPAARCIVQAAYRPDARIAVAFALGDMYGRQYISYGHPYIRNGPPHKNCLSVRRFFSAMAKALHTSDTVA